MFNKKKIPLLVLLVSLIISSIFIILGWSIRKLEHLSPEVGLSNIDFSSISQRTLPKIQIQIDNPTVIPYTIKRINLYIKQHGKEDTFARLTSDKAYKIKAFSRTTIPLLLSINSNNKDVVSTIGSVIKGFIIEGEIEVSILGFHYTKYLRKEYALSKLFPKC